MLRWLRRNKLKIFGVGALLSASAIAFYKIPVPKYREYNTGHRILWLLFSTNPFMQNLLNTCYLKHVDTLQKFILRK